MGYPDGLDAYGVAYPITMDIVFIGLACVDATVNNDIYVRLINRKNTFFILDVSSSQPVGCNWIVFGHIKS